VEFSMESEEGKALLASPNGAGMAWLLIMHKGVLGRKTVGKVIVFADEGVKGPRPPSLVFCVGDVRGLDVGGLRGDR
jgi:hypothetical protein